MGREDHREGSGPAAGQHDAHRPAGTAPPNGLGKQLYFNAGPNAASAAGNGLFGRIIAAGRGNGPESVDPSAVASLAVNPAAGAVSPASAPASDTSGDAQGAQAAAPASVLTSSDQPLTQGRHGASHVGAMDSVFARLWADPEEGWEL